MKTRCTDLGIALALGLAAFSRCAVAADAPAPAAQLPTAEDRALAARVEAVAQMPENTPGQEAANSLLRDWPYGLVRVLTSTNPVPEAQLANARGTIRSLVETAEQGPTWPRPPSLRIPYCLWPPKIDGRLSDWSWRHALTLTGTYALNTTNLITSPQTTFRMMWDKNNLYCAFECEDADIEAPPIERDGQVYSADCVELFILPDFEKRQYWEIIISPTGSLFDALHTKKPRNWGMDSKPEKSMEGLQIGRRIDGTPNNPADRDRGYVIEVAVPFKQLPGYTDGKAPTRGQQLHLLLARFDRTGKDIVYTYPFPVLSWGHNIWNYAPAELTR